ncbi:hypothetical protein IE53DRAFT_381856 [Violaceomyces palustris]|uniref:Uncharacterized protein n=1 Tax=Violaceomyces palustris TaxID=1673888 RepID=A0ACD0NPS6_9BASI|nr:hypothetical protein IE53DRAFT_381856 [Violaceomyces palustris]
MAQLEVILMVLLLLGATTLGVPVPDGESKGHRIEWRGGVRASAGCQSLHDCNVTLDLDISKDWSNVNQFFKKRELGGVIGPRVDVESRDVPHQRFSPKASMPLWSNVNLGFGSDP